MSRFPRWSHFLTNHAAGLLPLALTLAFGAASSGPLFAAADCWSYGETINTTYGVQLRSAHLMPSANLMSADFPEYIMEHSVEISKSDSPNLETWMSLARCQDKNKTAQMDLFTLNFGMTQLSEINSFTKMYGGFGLGLASVTFSIPHASPKVTIQQENVCGLAKLGLRLQPAERLSFDIFLDYGLQWFRFKATPCKTGGRSNSQTGGYSNLSAIKTGISIGYYI